MAKVLSAQFTSMTTTDLLIIMVILDPVNSNFYLQGYIILKTTAFLTLVRPETADDLS